MFILIWWLSGTAIMINEWRHAGKLDAEAVMLSAALGVLGPITIVLTILRLIRNLFRRNP